jgi:hypothetical protein
MDPDTAGSGTFLGTAAYYTILFLGGEILADFIVLHLKVVKFGKHYIILLSEIFVGFATTYNQDIYFGNA